MLDTYIGIWCIPITKEFSDKEEIRSLLPLPCETRLAKTLDTRKYVLVRKLEAEDLKSLDFVKYLESINIKNFKKNIRLLANEN